jgi:hypothetical protein
MTIANNGMRELFVALVLACAATAGRDVTDAENRR